MTFGIVLCGVIVLTVSDPVFGASKVTLSPSAPFDLETGSQFSSQAPDMKYDLVFSCGGGNEYLRALNGTAWALPVTDNFGIGPNVLRQATYSAPKNPISGYPDVFYNARQQFPENMGKVYYVRTSDGYLAKIRISRYKTLDPNPQACRALEIEYEVYPVKQGGRRGRGLDARTKPPFEEAADAQPNLRIARQLGRDALLKEGGSINGRLSQDDYQRDHCLLSA